MLSSQFSRNLSLKSMVRYPWRLGQGLLERLCCSHCSSLGTSRIKFQAFLLRAGFQFFIFRLSTVIGYSMFYILLSRGTVSRLSVQLYLVPVVSVIGGMVLLGEKVTAFTVLGGGIMLFAVALATRSRSGQVTKATGKDKI